MNYHTKFMIPKEAFFTGLVSISKLCKLSFIVGSFTAYFSGINVVLPLTGAFAGVSGSFFVGFMLLGMRMVTHGSVPLHFAAYHIPGLFSSWYWACNASIIRLWLPLACMVAF